MSVSITIPLDALQRPGVAAAVSNLVELLGQPEDVALTRLARSADSARRGAKGAGKAPLQSPARAEKPLAEQAIASPPSFQAPAEELSWAGFEASLSDTTRAFLALVAKERHVTMSRAVAALGLKQGKSMGGLTGSLRRKANNRGLLLPFHQTKTDDGERAWVARGAEGEDLPSSEPAPVRAGRKSADSKSPAGHTFLRKRDQRLEQAR